MLESAEPFRELADPLVERSLIASFYCSAQWPRGGVDPPIEKAALSVEVGFLLCNKVPHDVAQRGKVVLRLVHVGTPPKPQRGELRAQRDERRLVAKPDGVGRGVEGHRGLAGTDERGFVL